MNGEKTAERNEVTMGLFLAALIPSLYSPHIYIRTIKMASRLTHAQAHTYS